MESFLLDDIGDIVMKDGDIQIIDGADEVVQTFRGLMRTNLNEWFLNPEIGFDYSVVNGVKQINEDELRLALQSVVDQMDELDRVEDIQVSHERETRKAHIKCRVIAVDGQVFEYEEVF